MRSRKIQPKEFATPPMTISREFGGRRFYIASNSGSDGYPRGTFDRARALEFLTFAESRRWFESLNPTWRWALFCVGQYRLDVQSQDRTHPARTASMVPGLPDGLMVGTN